MIRPLRTLFIAGLALAFLAPALDAQAQSPADQKRTLKAWKLFYKAPGMIETEPRYMRGTLMITGSVPTEEHIAKAEGWDRSQNESDYAGSLQQMAKDLGPQGGKITLELTVQPRDESIEVTAIDEDGESTE